LLQKAVSHQERQARLSAAACGPKAVEHLIRALGGTSPGLDALAKIGEQGFDGTSVTGVRRMLEAGGVESKGMYLNRKDFSRLTGKHLWLREGHFVVVERARNRDVVVYDPQDGSTKPVALPPLDDPNFLATVVVVSQSPLPTQPQKS
jgi:ABC-type bacteriocin/lantibiotic exporter with double-glycine peptidase domain